jgi:hypothetical protein
MPDYPPTRTEELLTPANVEIVDIADRPTITIEDGLSVLSTVHKDIEDDPTYAILGHWMVLTPELREQIGANPIDISKSPEDLNARDGMRWLGHQAMDRTMDEQGIEDLWDLIRKPPSEAENPLFIPPYFRLYDGGVIYDIEGLEEDKIPTWQGIIGKYGATDPVVIDYFSQLEKSIRVDAAVLLNHLSSLVRISMIFYSEEDTLHRVANTVDNFLPAQGYEPDRSGVLVVDMSE